MENNKKSSVETYKKKFQREYTHFVFDESVVGVVNYGNLKVPLGVWRRTVRTVSPPY